ncbi:MAG: DUF4350 domain-containing protein [Sulfolobales archaeon]|nr:DUF4350 domain-containing protein [Sulfolobales archaeon]MDW8082460.1 DUF4350 domain-containing protein [Sulfolobales archaeon]
MKARVLLISILVILVLASLAIEREIELRVPSGASPFNTGPDGTSDLVRVLTELGVEVVTVRSWTNILSNFSSCLVVIVSPEVSYSSSELEAIRKLAARGSNILIADEGLYSNSILSYLNVPVRISGRVLLVDNSPIFTAVTRVSERELNVVYAYTSTLEIWETSSENVEVLSTTGNSTLAVLYRDENYSIVVVSDGTILTNSLINPKNVFNPNYLFIYYLVKNFCSKGVVLVEGSKYELRPPAADEVGAPAITLLGPLSRVLALSLLVLVVAHTATLKRVSFPGRSEKPSREAVRYYEIARLLCRDRELSKYIAEECRLFTKTRRARRLLNAVVEAMKKDREIAAAVLRAISGESQDSSFEKKEKTE